MFKIFCSLQKRIPNFFINDNRFIKAIWPNCVHIFDNFTEETINLNYLKNFKKIVSFISALKIIDP